MSIMLACLAAAMLTAMPVFASLSDQEQTEANITLESSVGPTKPVDPDEPSKPLNPGEEDDVEGSLVIVYATNFSFDSGFVSTETESYDLITTDRPNIQVVDLRGAGTGWYLNASLSPFKDSLNENSLPGARMVFAKANFNSVTSALFAPSYNTGVELTSDSDPKNIITADRGEGMGLWVNRFYEGDARTPLVKLIVPAGSGTVGNHTATITWVLSDTP